jgi:hypothetical protein
MNIAFLAISGAILIAGLLWLVGAKYLPADMAIVEAAEQSELMAIASKGLAT